jgi:hypothetical protein
VKKITVICIVILLLLAGCGINTEKKTGFEDFVYGMSRQEVRQKCEESRNFTYIPEIDENNEESLDIYYYRNGDTPVGALYEEIADPDESELTVLFRFDEESALIRIGVNMVAPEIDISVAERLLTVFTEEFGEPEQIEPFEFFYYFAKQEISLIYDTAGLSYGDLIAVRYGMPKPELDNQ